MSSLRSIPQSCLLTLLLLPTLPAQTAAELNEKIPQLNRATATIGDVVALFGKPSQYVWGNQTFTEGNLPQTYIAAYANGFSVVVHQNLVEQLRFTRPGFAYHGLEVGSSLEDVLEVTGAPLSTVTGQALQSPKQDVLYKDIGGVAGTHYFWSSRHSANFYFMNDRLSALYLLRLTQASPPPPPADPGIAKYNDVRVFRGMVQKDIRALDLSAKADILPTLTFNQSTVWPPADKMPATVTPEQILERGKNPGLGVRELHRQGITGRGVSVAIIDQPMSTGHPEYAGKIAAYRDFDCNSDASMHGPAVASLLAGTGMGTAPGATVYYAAAPSWLLDSEYFARALDWIVEESRRQPAGQKIRAVSVSAAPSGPGSPFKKNNELWDRAVEKAESEGILVLDCTQHHGVILSAWLSGEDPEDPASWSPGFPGMPANYGGRLLVVPSSPRTTAEEQWVGQYTYQYTGRGGLSWTIPYAAGVLALGWQLRPELTGIEMLQLLYWSAYMKDENTRIIDPKELIRLVREYRRP